MASKRFVDVLEAYNRSKKGQKVGEKDWDYSIIPTNAAALKAKYKLDFGKEIIPTDKATIKNLYLAGMEMLVTTGIYNCDTGRVIKVTEEEVKEGIKRAPKRLLLGSHRDSKEFVPRKGNASAKPVIQGGPTGAPVSEDVFIQLFQSYAQEPIVDTIVSGVMASCEGVEVKTKTPWEIKATLAEIRAIREACTRAGRPGMGI
ncbi:Monomethylamine methyltransferase MtmB [anaerobic digester metagenome]|jgi:methylamine--corrinoid protein Co-methyltransferase